MYDTRMRSAAEGTKPAGRFFEGEKWLVLTGLLGFLLAGICAGWVLLYGGPVPPEGNVSHAISFNAALGLFLLSTAAITPFSQMGTRSSSSFDGLTFMLLCMLTLRKQCKIFAALTRGS